MGTLFALRGGTREKSVRGLSWLGAAVPFLLLGYAFTLLMQTPVLGAADNLDFARVMRPAGIAHTEDPDEFHHRYVVRTFSTHPAHLLDRFSSPVALAWLAKHVRVFPGTRPGTMDLRQVGLVYLCALAALIVWALRSGVSPVLCSLLTWVLVDPGYCLYFNSFYGDAAFLLGAWGAYLWLVRCGDFERGVRPSWLNDSRLAITLALLLVLAGASKQVYVYLAAVVALPLILGAILVERSWRPQQIVAIATLVLAIALPIALFTVGSGPRFAFYNGYNRIFKGILVATDDPERAARKLGLREDLLDLTNVGVFSNKWKEFERVDIETFQEEVTSVSILEVALLYLTDPSAQRFLLRRIENPLAVHGATKPSFERDDPRGFEPKYSAWWQFSNLRSAIVRSIWPLASLGLLGLLGVFAHGVWRTGRCSSLVFGSTVLVLAFGVHVAAAIVGDGFFALHAHLLGARLYLDLLLATGIYAVVRWTGARVGRAGSAPEAGGEPDRSSAAC